MFSHNKNTDINAMELNKFISISETDDLDKPTLIDVLTIFRTPDHTERLANYFDAKTTMSLSMVSGHSYSLFQSIAHVKKLLHHIIDGDEKAAQSLLEKYPTLLFERSNIGYSYPSPFRTISSPLPKITIRLAEDGEIILTSNIIPEDTTFKNIPDFIYDTHMRVIHKNIDAFELALKLQDYEMCIMMLPYYTKSDQLLSKLSKRISSTLNENSKPRSFEFNFVAQVINDATIKEIKSYADNTPLHIQIDLFKEQFSDFMSQDEHFSLDYLIKAHELLLAFIPNWSQNNSSDKFLFFNEHVIRYIKTFLPSNYQQIFKQGIDDYVNGNTHRIAIKRPYPLHHYDAIHEAASAFMPMANIQGINFIEMHSETINQELDQLKKLKVGKHRQLCKVQREAQKLLDARPGPSINQ